MKHLLYILLFLTLPVMAKEDQTWKKLESEIQSVSESGYYNIELTPSLMGIANLDYSRTLRIYDKDGVEVPYFIRSDEMIKEESRLLYYDIVEKTAKDSLNKIIVANKEKIDIGRFLILTNPADVSLSVQVRGSNDRKDWFIVKQRQPLLNKQTSEQNKDILPVNFPVGNYQFYEITIQNSGQSPLDIIGVARTENEKIYTRLSQLNTISDIPFSVKDSTDKYTYIRFPHVEQNYFFNQVDFVIEYPSDYYREIVYLPYERYTFNLTSETYNTLSTERPMRLTQDSYFRIANQNNPPLKIVSVRLYCLNQYVCAFLTGGEKYTLVIDESQTTRAQYDIEHFRNKIPEDLRTLSLSKTKETIYKETREERPQLWIEKPVVLWSIIILIGLFLTLLCWKVMKQITP